MKTWPFDGNFFFLTANLKYKKKNLLKVCFSKIILGFLFNTFVCKIKKKQKHTHRLVFISPVFLLSLMAAPSPPSGLQL